MSVWIDPADLDRCAAILRHASKSFALAARLLPRRVREPSVALYAFCRALDDAVDERGESVSLLSERVARAYAGRPIDAAEDRVFAALVQRFGVPRVVPEALIEGMAWDVELRRYATMDALHGYAARVAGTVGVMMTLVMGPRETPVLARACDLGVAMQLTNIARDVGEDAARGRLYLPLEWLEEERIDPAEFLRVPRFTPELGRVVARTLDAADQLYRRADGGIAALPRGCRLAIRAAREVYSDIGRSVAANGFDAVRRRARVSTPRKAWLLARALAGALPRRRPAEDPPLEAARFLVEAVR